jgi:hypothetical protein
MTPARLVKGSRRYILSIAKMMALSFGALIIILVTGISTLQ